MFEPSDRAIRLQGISRAEYYALDPHTQKMIARGGLRAVEADNINIMLKLMLAMAEADPKMGPRIANIIEGGEPQLEKYIKRTFQAYLQTDMKNGIRHFYFNILKKAKAAQNAGGAKNGNSDTAQKTGRKTLEKGRNSHQTSSEGSLMGEKKDRKVLIAKLIADMQNRPVDAVLVSEGDIIHSVIRISDENPEGGISDSMVLSACKKLIDGQNDISFIKEALMSENRKMLMQAMGK